MLFKVLPSKSNVPDTGNDVVYLKIDLWNDYSYVTMFSVHAFDERGVYHHLSSVKIGFVDQTAETDTFSVIGDSFESLPEGYFSLGTDVEFYKTLVEDISEKWRVKFLSSLKDVVQDSEILGQAEKEDVFQTSHLRGVGVKTVKEQFVRVLNGEAVLTDFHFSFELPASEKFASFDLEFAIKASSVPSTNIHALIGRNGVGKTTLLNSMVKAIANADKTNSKFYSEHPLIGRQLIADGFFSSLVSVAFSAFDPFDLPPEQETEAQNPNYSYIGLTHYADDGGALTKSRDELRAEFVESFKYCMSEPDRKSRWLEAISILESDENFAEMKLQGLAELEGDEVEQKALSRVKKMSSGHTIVLLTLTQLVAKVEEKTLVLFDEPESHLHPPLLSALMVSLSQLLNNRNAIAIIATHSPVVLQEIPKSCVWKVFRERLSAEWSRPETETFGENVGTLTREVFQLEVEKSGFHIILTEMVSQGGTYEEILGKLNGTLGFEAKGTLRAMIVNRDAKANQQ